MVNKTFLTILVSIILTIILVAIVNVGLSIFLEYPDYEDFCNEFIAQETIETPERCEEIGGNWNPDGKARPPMPAEDVGSTNGFCDRYVTCRQELEDARKPYNQKRYYVFALIGFILLIIGLFAKESMFQLTGLSTGGILVFQGIVSNLENKIVVFITLLLILVVFGIVASRVIKKYK